jgi:hypothetical protein
MSRVPAWVAAGVVAANVAFALLTVPPSLLFGGHPIADLDYALHFSRAATADAFEVRDGRTWGYDPHFLAGYPMGTVFDVNNKGVELIVVAAHRLGVPLPTAFNILVFLTLMLPAPLMWAAARNFGLTPGGQAVAAAAALSLWIMDGQIRATWRIGVFASAAAMYALPFSLSYLYRFWNDPERRAFLVFSALAVALSLWHPLSFLFFYGCVVGTLVLLRVPRDGAFWAPMAILGLVVLLVNLFWVVPVAQQWALKTRSGYHFIGDLRALQGDLLGFNDSGLRIIVYVFAAAGLWRWWDEEGQREKAWFFLGPVLALSVFGYLSGELHAFRELETYRNNLVVSFLLIVPAADALRAAAQRLSASRRAPAWIAVASALVITLKLSAANFLVLGPYLKREFGVNRLHAPPPEDRAVIDWLKLHGTHDHRVMVEHWPLGALVPWYTDLDVIGGPYPLVWLPHNFANFADLRGVAVDLPQTAVLFGRPIAAFVPEELAASLETYNVGLIVAHSQESIRAFGRVPTIELVEVIGRYNLYRNARASLPFLKGEGALESDVGRIRITGASMGELVLKYHWSPLLVSRPAQPLVPYRVGADPVAFLRVPNNHYREFEIADRE